MVLVAVVVLGLVGTAVLGVVEAVAVRVDVQGPVLDTCGTGGDGQGTLNISTAVAFVAAAAGVRVAKHGNRAASSRVGAADVLEACGAAIDLGPEAARTLIEEVGIAFLFAPRYHPAVRHVAPARREVGFRTLFNLTGPLCNPAGATRQLLGLFSADWLDGVAAALAELGSERALVVHGADGSDEISLAGTTWARRLDGGRIEVLELHPEQFGIQARPMDAVAGGEAADNARALREVLAGAAGAATDVVVLNAGAALWVAGRVESIEAGVDLARELVAGPQPLAVLDRFVQRSQELAA